MLYPVVDELIVLRSETSITAREKAALLDAVEQFRGTWFWSLRSGFGYLPMNALARRFGRMRLVPMNQSMALNCPDRYFCLRRAALCR